MTTHFFREIDRIKARLLGLGAQVEENLNRAVRAIAEQDEALARQVIEADAEVDEQEVEVEEETLKVLTLHQPVATDLRFLVAVLKINNDLERIGDLAVNIAEHAIVLSAQPPPELPMDFVAMGDLVKTMLRESLDAFIDLDSEIARRVLGQDDAVDKMNVGMYALVKRNARKDASPEKIDVLIRLLSVSRNLERIADHATNIAEDLVYMIEGRIVRHHAKDAETQALSNGESEHTGGGAGPSA
jgi:phosphate transport system protein